MDITVNGIPEHVETTKASITVDELLRLKKFSFRMLVVRVNGELIRKENYSTATIAQGDDVQVIHLISGG
jgi:thiamine biosynthesis protein ThiS